MHGVLGTGSDGPCVSEVVKEAKQRLESNHKLRLLYRITHDPAGKRSNDATWEEEDDGASNGVREVREKILWARRCGTRLVRSLGHPKVAMEGVIDGELRSVAASLSASPHSIEIDTLLTTRPLHTFDIESVMLCRPAFQRLAHIATPKSAFRSARALSTLPSNPHIYVFQHPLDSSRSVLSLLPTEPPNVDLSLGTTSSVPPTPDSFKENRHFHPILQSILSTHAVHDPIVKQQAAAFASPGGFNLGTNKGSGDGAGGANHQAGMGGANKGGWIHVSDERNPPDWGRIAWPEDIFGSVEVDGDGKLIGNWQDSGTYRIITREGM